MSSIYIVEGVPGSGKDTLIAQLLTWLEPERRHVRSFPEEAVLASWLHYFVPGIHESRLSLTTGIVRHIEQTLEREPDTVFVFNRFHVSHAIWRAEMHAPPELELKHADLVASLARLPTLVLHVVIDPADAATRTAHQERREVAWHRFLEQRLETHGQTSAGDSYIEQQETVSRMIEQDGLPYRRVSLRPGEAIDVGALIGN